MSRTGLVGRILLTNLPPPSAMTLHPTATTGFSKAAQAYSRGRPDYPAETGGWLTDGVGIGPGTRVIDLGAGTGKFTTRLVDSGATVLAVEPVRPMLAELVRTAPGAIPVIGSATDIPLADASVDVVVCAQAFHWFATTAALDEIHRVLRPDGRLALIWNLRDTSVPWAARINDIVNRHEGDAPRFYRGDWRAVFPHPGFGPLEESQFANAHTGPADDVIIGRALSTSFISALPEAQRAAVEADLRQLINGDPALANRAEVSVPYRTHAFVARKREASGG